MGSIIAFFYADMLLFLVSYCGATGINSMMTYAHNSGKKLMTARIVKHAFEIIHLLTGEVRKPFSIPFCMCWIVN